MANTRFQLKRSIVSGVTPTTSDITAGELGVNLRDRKLFTSNGSAVFELGSNQTNLSVTSNLTIGANGSLVLANGAALYANGSAGSAGQVLASNGTGVYWLSASGTGSVTSVDSGNGLTGGPITTTGSLSVLANNGVTANSTGVFVTAGSGVVVNATGVHVDSSYISTLTANVAGFLGNSSGTLANVASWISGNAAAAYSNATVFASNASNINTGTLANAVLPSAINVTSVNAASLSVGPVVVANTQGLTSSANITVTSSADLILAPGTGLVANSSYGNPGQVLTTDGSSVYWSSVEQSSVVSQQFTANGTANSFIVTSGYIPSAIEVYIAGVKQIPGVDVDVSSGSTVNFSIPPLSGQVVDIFGYRATISGGGSVISVSGGAGLTGTVTSSGSIAALANNGVVANSSGLFVRQGTGTVVNATGVHVNSSYIGSISANNATFFDGVSLSTVQAQITGNAATAYTNAVANAAALYQTTAGLATNVATLAANAATFLGNSSGTIANVSLWITSNAAAAYSNAVANAAALYQTRAGLASNVATLTANNATNLAGNPASFYTNASNISTGTLPNGRLSPAVVNTSGNFTVGGNIVFQGTNNQFTAGLTVGSNVVANTTQLTVGNTTVFTSINSTAVNTGTLFTTGNASIGGSLTVTGNLTVNGTYVTVSGNSVVYSDNMLFLNQGVATTITNVASNGTTVVFTANNNYQIGWDVLVSNVNPSSYNGLYNVTAANSTTFTVANTNIATYIAGGTVRGQTESNPDIGIAAGYNDGTYRHTGIFRDATDGVWKVFDSYLPEPDTSVFIDTANSSFNLAPFQANIIYVGNTTVFGTINTTNFSGTSNNAINLGGLSLATIQSQITSNAAAAYSNAVANAAALYQTTAGLAANVATLTANNATNLAGNPASFYTNASNISAGTLPNDRLSSAVVNTSGNFTVAGNINFTAANVNFANVHVGANVDLTTTSLFVGNTTVNTIVTAGQVSLSGATVNSTIYQGTANNANNLNGQSASFYTNATNITAGTLNNARLPATINLTTVNAATLSVGTAVVANSTGIITTGTISTSANASVNNNLYYQTTTNRVLPATISVSNTLTLNVAQSNFFSVTLDRNISTFTITGTPAGVTVFYVVNFNVQGNYTISWPTGFRWVSGVVPALSNTANDIHTFIFYTTDGGVTTEAFSAGYTR